MQLSIGVRRAHCAEAIGSSRAIVYRTLQLSTGCSRGIKVWPRALQASAIGSKLARLQGTGQDPYRLEPLIVNFSKSARFAIVSALHHVVQWWLFV